MKNTISRVVFLCWCCFCSIAAAQNRTQQITALQYYFNTDPGAGVTGNGAVISVTPDSVFNQSVSMVIPGNLSEGLHTLFVRVKDEWNRWSLAERRVFYVMSSIINENITAYQYYFNTDPGTGIAGNGAIINIGSVNQFNAPVSIVIPPSLSTGIHTLFVRARDVSGQWSQVERRVFYVNSAKLTTLVTGLEYYFDVDPGIGNANPFPVTAGNPVNILASIGVPCLSTGTHYLYIRARDEFGQWSIVDRDTLTITSGVSPSVLTPAGPLSLCLGDSVLITSTPIAGATWQWQRNGIDIPGATSFQYYADTAGSYSLKTSCGVSFTLSSAVVVNQINSLTWYADADGDGFGNAQIDSSFCFAIPGWVNDSNDCEDADVNRYPGAAEVCNLVDDDCDGMVDEGLLVRFYADADGDGFGNLLIDSMACQIPSGFVADSSDCNDANTLINPGATEVCINGIDENCNQQIDEGPLLYAGPDQEVCADSTIISVAGGNNRNSQLTQDPFSGYWSVISGGGIIDDSTALATIVRQLPPGRSVFRFTSVQDSCVGFDDVEVFSIPKPVLSITGLPDSICLNKAPVVLSGLPSNGTFSGTGISSNVFSPVMAGVQQIRYITSPYYACPADTIEKSINVLSLPAVSVQASPGTIRCENGSVQLTAITSGASFQWNNGSSQPVVTAANNGVYTLSTVGLNGCVNRDSIEITEEIKPAISVNGSLFICPGESRILSIQNVNSVSWNTGATSTSIAVSPSVTTMYSISGSSVNGCAVIDSVRIVVNPNLPPTPVTNMFPVNNAQDVSLPVNFSWLPGSYNTSYDLYYWPASGSAPATPNVSGITALNQVITSGFAYGQTYAWKIVSRNGTCFSVDGPVQTFNVRELPDLAITNPQLPATGFSGQTIGVSWITNNTGNGSTDNVLWSDGIYLSLDTIFQSFDVYLGGHPNVTALTPGQSYSASRNVTIPATVSGNYYLIMVADNFTQLQETNETNNRAVSLSQISISIPPLPDLRVTGVVTVNNAFSGDTVTLTYTVKNFGGAATAASFWRDQIYVTSQPFLNFQQTSPSVIITHSGNLLPDSTYTKTIQVPLPKYVFGPYYIFAVTDLLNQVNEGVAESNNQGSTLLDIFLTPPPDLDVEFFNTPSSAGNGETILLNWRVKNIGFTSTDNPWSDRLYISTDSMGNLNNAIVLATLPVIGTLMPDTFYNRSASITIPNIPSGNYYLYVKTDAFDQVFEYTAKQNNLLRSAGVFTLLNTDLVVDSVHILNTLSSGTTTTVSWRIRNTGNGGVFNKNRKDVIYLSINPVFNPSTATAIDSVSFTESIPSGAVRLKQKSVTIPPSLNGNYYLFVQCDKDNAITESDELNNFNLNILPVTINLTAWTDLEGVEFMVPDTLETILQYSLRYTVQNNGSLAVNGSWRDSIFVSRQPVWNRSSAVWLTNRSILKLLNTGEAYQESAPVELPMIQQIPGTGNMMYLYVKTDALNSVFEHTGENNNILRSNVFYCFDNYVDHELMQVIGPDSGASGRSATVQWIVRNNGGRSNFANYNNYSDVLLLSTDTLPDNGDIIAHEILVSEILSTGSSYTRNRTFNLPNGISGTYYLIAFTDFYDEINGEINRSNNYQLVRTPGGVPSVLYITASPAPDLIVQSFQVPANGISGQPLKVYYHVQNAGVGETYPSAWRDGINLSSNPSLAGSNIGTFLNDKPRTGTILPGNGYSDSLEVTLPMVSTGNYYLKLNIDQNDVVYENNSELNNRVNAFITITQPLPSDLVVQQILAADSVLTGDILQISWTLVNKGLHPATGQLRNGIYLSSDTIADIHDHLLGSVVSTINIPPGGQLNQSSALVAAGVEIGSYYVLVRTDLLNNIPESDEGNNTSAAVSTTYIGVPQLPLATNVSDTLSHAEELYYYVEIPDSLAGQTLLVTIDGAAINWSNELYVSHEQIPDRAVHDFIYSVANAGDQEIIVPSLLAGKYYIYIKGNYQLLSPPSAIQPVVVRAEILPFAIRTVDAPRGGNTGNVTVKLSGSKFISGMTASLQSTFSSNHIGAANVFFVNSTTVFATFPLNQKPLGIYDVLLTKPNGDTAKFSNGFEIESGNSGGFYVGGVSNSGMTGSPGSAGCSPGAEAGLNSSLQVNVNSPANAFSLSIVPMSILFGNTGNTDIPVPSRLLVSVDELPVSFDIEGLAGKKYELYVEFVEQNGPPGILRAGSSGTINFFVYTTRTSGTKKFKLQ